MTERLAPIPRGVPQGRKARSFFSEDRHIGLRGVESGTDVAAQTNVRRIIVPLNHRVAADDSLYGVRVVGDLGSEGSWEPCIEFQSRSGIKLETCPDMRLSTSEALKEWAERLDEPYLLEALARASKGPIRRVRKSGP